MNDDRLLLANAYLDGELADDERASAAADPEIMAEVDRLQALQDRMRAVEAPTTEARRAAIAAALAEFEQPGTSSGATAAGWRPPERSARRSWPGRVLAVAAAVVAIGLAGVVVANLSGGSDDDSADMTASETEASIAQVATGAPPEPPAANADADGGTDQADGTARDTLNASTEMAPTPATTTLEPRDDEVASATILADATSPYPTTGGPIVPVTDRDQVITGPGELAGLGVLLAGLRDDRELGPTPETDCAVEPPAEIVGRARYRLADGTVRDVLVALVDDGTEGHTAAFDAETCDVVDVGP